MKFHKGTITDWFRESFDKETMREAYKEDVGLGFIVRGRFWDHPTLTGFGHTSWVLSEVLQEDGSYEIETRNSKYTLRDPQ